MKATPIIIGTLSVVSVGITGSVLIADLRKQGPRSKFDAILDGFAVSGILLCVITANAMYKEISS